MMNGNLGMAIVCMVEDEHDAASAILLGSGNHSGLKDGKGFHHSGTGNEIGLKNITQNNLTVLLLDATKFRPDGGAPRLRWSAEDEGWIFGAFNAGKYLVFKLENVEK